MTRGVTVLIVDDEPAARRRIARMAQAHPDLVVVGEAGDGAAALEAVGALRPDVVFVDVEMPVLDGVTATRAMGGAASPLIVFVTAHDQFAASAFQQDAVDYLLKPFDDERFAIAVARIRRRLDQSAGRPPPPRDRLLALVRGAARLLRVGEVDHLVAAGNYAEVVMLDGSRFLVRETISALAETLPAPFARISRSTIIRLDQIERIAGSGHGDATLALSNGTSVRLSRRYRTVLAGLAPAVSSRSSQD